MSSTTYVVNVPAPSVLKILLNLGADSTPKKTIIAVDQPPDEISQTMKFESDVMEEEVI